MRTILLLAAALVTVFSIACSDLLRDHSKEQLKQESPCTARFVPVGNNPDIALDTQTGTLCRTVGDANDPLGIRNPGDKTWIRGAGDEKPDKYTRLPVCSKVIVAAPPNRVPSFAEWKKSQQENQAGSSKP
jgi:hypothetical protein